MVGLGGRLAGLRLWEKALISEIYAGNGGTGVGQTHGETEAFRWESGVDILQRGAKRIYHYPREISLLVGLVSRLDIASVSMDIALMYIGTAATWRLAIVAWIKAVIRVELGEAGDIVIL